MKETGNQSRKEVSLVAAGYNMNKVTTIQKYYPPVRTHFDPGNYGYVVDWQINDETSGVSRAAGTRMTKPPHG